MNDFLSNILLGFVQGMTEFLPVSSSGHLLLLEKCGIGEPSTATNLLLHCATLLVVLVQFRKQVWFCCRHPTSPQTKFLLIASLPTALSAGLIRYVLPDLGDFLPTAFLLTSILLLLPYLLPKTGADFTKGRGGKALFVGTMQGLACVSGISRSGMTAMALLLAGCPQEECSSYSFLLSVPVIVGSSVVELLTGSAVNTLSVSVIPACIVATFSGFLAIRWFSGILAKGKLYYFSIYTFLLSVLSFFLLFP